MLSNRLERIKRKLAEREIVAGTACSLGDCSISELFGFVGYDFVWIDAEHTSMDKRELQLHLMALRGTGTASIVRVPWNDPVLVKPILDMGVDGVIFPMIRTAQEAQLAVKACRYPPEGVRGYGPLAAAQYGMIDSQDYIRHADSTIWKIMQIEHVDAVENLDDILQVDGVDAILIGANDLSASIGLLGQPNHPSVQELLDRIGESAKRLNKPLGVAVGYAGGYDPSQIQKWIERGMSWIIVGGDIGFLKHASEEALRSVRALSPRL